ncbi:hypothetical protein DEJ23_10820 [Curtobacterium sp. MCSS17_008]|uniref:helix-turn-helix domain-containing protein n=1 Tax=Curtobacterium sp. MCSS17_008 TaxID=2175647 RepID=UPI000DA987B8|nr:XRE family transcriptional regulator [Curtobacterium sp. MCSS17_008]PZF56349.1 hypothetical protein DEJ23_10820 [Curtobacterium sp. MCSS17_008]
MIDFHKVRGDERERLGRAFKQLREDAGWSVREVAACLQRDPSVVTRIEAGKLTLTEEHIVKLRRELGVSIDDLIDRSSPPSPFLAREEWSNTQGHWRALTPSGRRDRLFALTMERQASQPHTCIHAGEEFVSVLSGAVVVTLGRTEHRIEAHSAVLTVAPYESHAVRLAPDCERAELLWTLPSDGLRRHTPVEGPVMAWTCLTDPEHDEIEKQTVSKAEASHTLER